MARSLVVVLVVASFALVSCKQEPPAATVIAAAPPDTVESSAPPPPASVAELPDYPGATRVAFAEKAASVPGKAAEVEARFTTPDGFAAVVAHFDRVVAERGWTVTKQERKADKVEWKLVKGTSTAEIDLEAKDGLVRIKVARSTR